MVMVHCYWILKKKPMCNLDWWDWEPAWIINWFAELKRDYIINNHEWPIKFISFLDLQFIVEDWYNKKCEQYEILKEKWYQYEEQCAFNTKRYKYIMNNIELWVKIMNILINNHIVKYKMREIDYPENLCTYSDLSYNDYLKTERWNMIRNAAFKRDWNKCVVCWSKDKLHWHHRSYKMKWVWSYLNELKDVYTLCERCHKMFHNNVNIKELW